MITFYDRSDNRGGTLLVSDYPIKGSVRFQLGYSNSSRYPVYLNAEQVMILQGKLTDWLQKTRPQVPPPQRALGGGRDMSLAKMLRWLLTVLGAGLVSACASGGYGLPPGELTPGRWSALDGEGGQTYRVIARERFPSFSEWTNSPWYRQDRDHVGEQFYVLLTDNNIACVVDPNLFTAVPDGDELRCHWRQPRGVS